MSDERVDNANYAGRPSMCRNCGALVGANETSCSLCGAPKDSVAAAQTQAPVVVHDHETVHFARAILSRPYIFTIIFLVANVFVFMLMWSSSGLNSATLWEPPQSALYAYGAKLNKLINENHEWWRFVTPVFIHIGLAHLLINMYGLWMIGPYVERLYGSAKFVVLWVLTGVLGVVASYLSYQPKLDVGAVGHFLFRAEDVPSAGASGALFGLVGVLFVFGIKYRRELPEGFKRAFGTGLLPVILLNLFIGYIGRGFIDNAAHLGGLLSGALFGLVIHYKRPDERAGVTIVWRVLQVLALALVTVSFVMVARHFKDYPLLNNSTSEVATYLNAINAGEAAFVDAYNKRGLNGIETAIEELNHAPHPDDQAAALQNELKSLLARMKEFLRAENSKDRQPAQARENEKEKLGSDFSTWQKNHLEWIKTEGQKYGITLTKQDANEPDSTNSK